MDDIVTTSVSKGCFVIADGGKAPPPINVKDYLSNEGIQTSLRWQMAQRIWNDIDLSINDLHQKLQEEMFLELMEFIEEAHSCKDNESGGRRTEIPTAALITGVNMPDHSALFDQLQHKVKSMISSYVVILEAKHCANMKTLMRVIGDQLMMGCSNEEDVSDEFDFMRRKTTSLTLTMIEKWYMKIIASQKVLHSPKKKQKLTKEKPSKPPIVIMCQDFEGFPQKILQDFILMCSFHAHRMPIVFVFGVATSWSDVSQRLLPHSAIVHLSVRKFNAPSASSHLALIIDKILLTSDHPFKLSGRCLQLVLDVFLCHDFSITNFVHTLKFCVMEHFYDKNMSILCWSTLEDANNIISNLTKHELQALRKVDSLNQYIQSLDTDQQKSSKKPAVLKEMITKSLHDMHDYHVSYFPVLRSLHSFTSSLPHHPMGKQIRELYISCFRTELAKFEGYKQAFILLKVSSRDQLINRLQSCISPLEVIKDDKQSREDELNVMNTCIKIKTIVNNLKMIGDNDGPDEEDDGDNTEENEETLETVKYAYQLQERLRNRANQKKIRRMTKFEKLREEALEYLKQFYEFHLRKVQTLPLYETFYFDSPGKLKRHIVAAPRLSIQTALSDPYQYLQVSSLETIVSGIIPTNAPDICVAYKLHNESGSIINLYDWMAAFHTIVTSSPATEDKENDDTEEINVEIDEVTQARFIRAVSELQLLGFIKPTKKKTDHVQRLTWSHV